MFCTKCGTENNDRAKFCQKCGASLDEQVQAWEDLQQTQKQPVEIEQRQQPKGKKGVVVAVIAAVVIVLAAVGCFGVKLYLDHQEQLAQEQLEEKQAQEQLAQAQKEQEEKLKQEQWDAYVAELKTWMAQMDARKGDYVFTAEEENYYTSLCQNIQDSIAQQVSADIMEGQKQAIETFYTDLAASNQEQIQAQASELENAQLEFALESELEAIETYRAKVQNCLNENNYVQAMNLLQQWRETVTMTNVDFSSFQVSVRQYDLSEFPNIKLYVDVTDQGGNFVDNLGTGAFFINEGRSLDGELTRANITNAAKLNQNEGISIGLVADVSGSMYYYMDETKNTMISFLNSVQFDKGDEIEIVEFSEQAYICQSYTNNASEVINSVYAMEAGGTTRLYDTLINEIARIQSRDNAKCIIGFTDGIDNESIYTAQDVVDRAVAANVPVFLIGIGSECDASTLSYIAQSTNGIYQNIDSVGSLAEIYNAIYTEQKNVYLIEYSLDDGNEFSDAYVADIYVRAEGGQGGCCKQFSVSSMDFFRSMYNKFLVAGIDCQTRGERNLLDSGLIVTTEEAYSNPECIAYQSQAAINSGGVGSRNSSIFEVLVGYSVIDVVKDGDGYILYGMSNYDISKTRTYGKATKKEKEYVNTYYSNVADDTMFWFEENISNYEKLRMIRDTDGKWKFYSRVYERNDGGDAIMTNAIYQAIWN